jgi:predicted lipoprotein with Yx(FWY)xxD motif
MNEGVIMFRSSRLAALTIVLLSALVMAACGSTGSSTTGSGGAPASVPQPTAGTPSGTVDVARTGLGSVLADSHGRTLYLWQADTASKSTCTGACATAWPPLETSAKPTAGSGVKSSLLSTTKRADGSEQVTYNGHPLYTFQGDTASGQTNGQRSNGFGALWLVLSPTGTQITSSASSSGSSPSTGY